MNDSANYDKRSIGLEFITSSFYNLETLEQYSWFVIRSSDGNIIERINSYKVVVIHYEVLDGFLTFTTEDYDTIGVNIFDVREFRATYDKDAILEMREDIEESRLHRLAEESKKDNYIKLKKPHNRVIEWLVDIVNKHFK